MKIFNINLKRYNIIKNRIKTTVRYLCKNIYINKKVSNQWVTVPKTMFKSMSDNIHYVNLMPYKPFSTLIVGMQSYFASFIEKIKRVGGMFAKGSSQIQKNTKSLYPIGVTDA